MNAVYLTDTSNHHPNCDGCCVVGRCHWCLNRPRTGAVTSVGGDGFTYVACRVHLQFLTEAQRGNRNGCGADMMGGLKGLSISDVPFQLR